MTVATLEKKIAKAREELEQVRASSQLMKTRLGHVAADSDAESDELTAHQNAIETLRRREVALLAAIEELKSRRPEAESSDAKTESHRVMELWRENAEAQAELNQRALDAFEEGFEALRDARAAEDQRGAYEEEVRYWSSVAGMAPPAFDHVERLDIARLAETQACWTEVVHGDAAGELSRHWRDQRKQLERSRRKRATA